MEAEGFVKFSIKTNSVPQSFDISREIDELINTPIQGYNFDKEMSLIDKYKNLKKLQQEKSAKVGLVNFDAKPPPNPVIALNLGSTKEQTISHYERKIDDMMSQTKQEKDVCCFYLESTNWDLKEAIELYKSMTEG